MTTRNIISLLDRPGLWAHHNLSGTTDYHIVSYGGKLTIVEQEETLSLFDIQYRSLQDRCARAFYKLIRRF